MWISVSELAKALNVSTRAVQVQIKNGVIVARKKDKKSYEVDLSTLPSNWMEKLPEEYKQHAGALTTIGGTSSVVVSSSAQSALGRALTKKEKLRAEVAAHYNSLDPLMKESVRAKITATIFAISPSTVRRMLKEVAEYGVLGAPRKDQYYRAWTPEAIDYMQAWYLSFIKTTSINSKKAAYDATVKMAAEKGWRIGCRSAAYTILSEIPELMKRYAIAGSRALDNFFYIDRDWSKLKPSQIWIGDQHICDFWVVDKSNPGKWRYYRPTVYVWEDGATRCIAGLAVDENYNADTVIESVRMGIGRFGFFDCTYNDNGSSECSKAATQIIDELIILSDNKCHMRDISELYKTADGCYVTEDPDGNFISVEETSEEWHRKHRRIYANVKNAKAKPIERLFSSIEMKMAQRGIPGHVVTPGAPADQEEKESKVLAYQKEHDQILTLDEFMVELIKGIDEYEHTYHSTLKMSPWEAVQKHIAEGWRAARPASQDDLDFIFLSRTRAKIRKGRVTINGLQYKGEDLKVVVGQFADVGLNLHEGEVCDLRYSKYDPALAYAVFPHAGVKIRPLKLVESIDMLDDEAMKEGIAWKRAEMRKVREVFSSLELPLGITMQTKVTKQVTAAKDAIEAVEVPAIEPPKVHKQHRSPGKLTLHASNTERYQYCIDMELAGQALSQADKAFKEEYEESPEYIAQKSYWETYRRLGGQE